MIVEQWSIINYQWLIGLDSYNNKEQVKHLLFSLYIAAKQYQCNQANAAAKSSLKIFDLQLTGLSGFGTRKRINKYACFHFAIHH